VPYAGFAGVPAPPVFISGEPASPVLYIFFFVLCTSVKKFWYVGENVLYMFKQNTRTNVHGRRRKTNKAGRLLISTNVPIVDKVDV